MISLSRATLMANNMYIRHHIWLNCCDTACQCGLNQTCFRCSFSPYGYCYLSCSYCYLPCTYKRFLILLAFLLQNCRTFTHVLQKKNTTLNFPENQKIIPYKYFVRRNGLSQISLIRRASSSFKHNASFVARLPTIRRHKSQSLHSPGNAKPPGGSGGTSGGGSARAGRCPRVTDINASSENLGEYHLCTFVAEQYGKEWCFSY